MKPENETVIGSYASRKFIMIVAAAIALLLVLVFGLVLNIRKSGSKDQAKFPQNSAQVEITKNGFTPATLTIPKGTKVTWTNGDTKPHVIASNPHPIHDGLKGLDSKDIIGIQGGTYSFTFNKLGEFSYHDHLNPTVNGTIIVVN